LAIRLPGENSRTFAPVPLAPAPLARRVPDCGLAGSSPTGVLPEWLNVILACRIERPKVYTTTPPMTRPVEAMRLRSPAPGHASGQASGQAGGVKKPERSTPMGASLTSSGTAMALLRWTCESPERARDTYIHSAALVARSRLRE